jgi:glutamate-1-semialdehyde 2,1-aminomutase
MEPSGASFGAVPLSFEFLAAVRELTRATGALLVFDEVVSGFRWSPGGLQRLAGVTPDLTTLAKIVAGGMPGGALAGTGGVMEVLAFRPGSGVKVKHPGTHNAHPVSAAAGVTTLDLVADGSAQSRADETAEWLRRELNAVFERAGAKGFVYGESSTFLVMAGIERPPGPPVEWAGTRHAAVLKRGMKADVLSAMQAGMLLEGVHLFQGRGLVSTAHTDADVERTVSGFEKTLRRLQQERLL